MSATETSLFIVASAAPSALIAFLGCFAMRRIAGRIGLLDRPGERKVHHTPIPLGGGVAIWLGVVGAFAGGQLALVLGQPGGALAAAVPEFAKPHLEGVWHQVPTLWGLLAAGTVLMLVGLIDDRWGLHWAPRLGVQFLVAAGCVYWLESLRLTAFLQMPLLTGLLTVIWIVGLVNSFNMLDNMDGASAGIAIIAGGMLSVFLLFPPASTATPPQLFVAGFLLVVVGAAAGFLWHNRPPARLFMGDAGAYFIGFCVAVATLLATFTSYSSPDPKPHAILAPVFVMAVPLYDMITVLWIRIRAGQMPTVSDKNHFSHRLVDLGLTKTQAVLTIYLTTATCGLGALLLHRVDLFGAGIIALLILCVLSLIHILEHTARGKINRE